MAGHGRGRKLWFLVTGIVIGIAIGLVVSRVSSPDRSGEDATPSETVITTVNYPFGDSMQGWSLVLCETDGNHMISGREIRLYDEAYSS